MSWEVVPEPEEAEERAALIAAGEEALAKERESAWWRSGLDELGGGPTAKQEWRDPGVVEP